jgi:thiol:disulfide interchange protein DsbD
VVTLDATIEDGWHVYSVAQPAAQPGGGPIPTRITIVSGQNVTAAGDPKAETPPQVSFDSAFRMNVAEHDRQARFTVPIALATAPAPDSVRVDVRYQTCNASLCLPPRTVHLAAAMTRGS